MTFDPFGDFESRGYLRNFAGAKDPGDVKELEHEGFRAGLNEAITMLQGQTALTYRDVLESHHRLFRDVYPWAGEDRSVNAPSLTIGKGGRFDLFADPHEIRRSAEHALSLARTPATMRERPGEVMGYLAYAHPFLDGNGRTIMVVHGELCRRADMHVHWAAIPKHLFLSALTKELDAPGRGHLDNLLRPHIRAGRISRAQEAAVLRSLPGLGPPMRTAAQQAYMEPAPEASSGGVGPGLSAANAQVHEHKGEKGAQQEHLLAPNILPVELSQEALTQRTAADPHLAPYLTTVAVLADRVFRNAEAIARDLTGRAIDTPEEVRELRSKLYEAPESLGELRGETGRFGREDAERQGARGEAASLGNALSELAAAARSIKAELQADWSEFVQREQIAVPEPSEDLQAVLKSGEMSATQIAEAARKEDLVSEINRFLDAASKRFGPDNMAAIRGGRLDELRGRMSSIKEHDLERAARLTHDVTKLHDRVEAHHQQQERQQSQEISLVPGTGRG